MEHNQRQATKQLKLNKELVHLIDSKRNCEDFANTDYKWMTYVDRVNLERSAYNTFKSFGFSNIDSKQLRLKLISLYENIYSGYIDKPYEISKSRYEALSLDIINKNFFYDDKRKSWVPHNCDSLFNDMEYKSLISFEIELKEWRLEEHQKAIDSTQALLKEISSL